MGGACLQDAVLTGLNLGVFRLDECLLVRESFLTLGAVNEETTVSSFRLANEFVSFCAESSKVSLSLRLVKEMCLRSAVLMILPGLQI